jgi:aspartyl-tRNA synthetase
MYRSNTCGELRLSDAGKTVMLSGWVQRVRDLGAMSFIDLRDRYGITQLVVDNDSEKELSDTAKSLGREDVISVTGKVIERTGKNKNIPTGEVEIALEKIEILNRSKTPPFTIEEETDGGEELRMKYRYLDLRRSVVKNNLLLRHQLAQCVRQYMNGNNFLEIETPFLIKSTPEGARDFVVPSRMNEGQFYALPQSPQTFKQLLMVAGFDRYYQIVRCFRDEDLRADRQPEFTQIDCEMSFVEQEDVLNIFEGLLRHILKEIKGIELKEFPRMTFDDAMRLYGNDKPDIRFGMKITELKSTLEGGKGGDDLVSGKNFKVFDDAEYVAGICVEGSSEYTRKQLDELTEWIKRPQIGATGLVYVRYNSDGTLKSSVDKFFDEATLRIWAEKFGAKPGDLILVLAGAKARTQKALSELRLEMGNRLGLRKKDTFQPLWVLDFPLVEWDEEAQRWNAMHHPFTSPKKEHIELMNTNPAAVKANAYDLVLNGSEIAGGSIRIHDRGLQEQLFTMLGISKIEAEAKFGFLMNAFEYGAPPHGGIAFGLDRLCAILGGADSIRDFIAFPKNNAGRDVMLDAPSAIDEEQLKELHIQVKL